ncbi:hypothetical protein [Pedobacter sp. SYP-B3415]|uniref:hypothetical protein n=1 Tax=Pedobacter sp. SYP-B3415 TaxID=2496641 RepID=UPI00101C01AF|nr:hypothetical protein [Pedobacter sp. SYP-B3415]
MAKELKAIECPKCGSTRKVELKPDYFKCGNCDTEYFLDNDDITINHNINYRDTTPVSHNLTPKAMRIIFAVVIFFIIAGYALSLLFSRHTQTSELPLVQNTETFRWVSKDAIPFENSAGSLVIAILGRREYDDDEQKQRTGMYAAFYDALSEKLLIEQRLDQPSEDHMDSFQFSIFQNGDIYAIANKSTLYKIDKVNTKLNKVQGDFFSRHEDLAAGIAQVEFISRDWGDGLKVMTNDGKSRSFFPIEDRVYTEKQRYAAEDALETRNPSAKTRTYALFSERSDDFPDEKVKLFVYRQKDNRGGPNDRPFFQKREYNDFYGKTIISDIRQGQDLVISYKDLTPDRLYFSPDVLYTDSQYVVIMYSATAAQDANLSVQCLDINNGRIIFTLPVGKEKGLNDVAYRFKDGFVLENYNTMFITDMKGKITKEFKLTQ